MVSAAAKPLLIFLLAASHFAVIAYAENGNDQQGDHGHHHASHHPPAPPTEHHRPFRRSLVAVTGAVFCQSCKYAGKNDFSEALPIKGAVVKLECKNTAKLTTLTAKTDERGFFYIQTRNVTSNAHDKCRVFLVSSPLTSCDKPTNLLDGLTGAKLNWYQQFYLSKVSYVLYTAGPFAFLPKCI